MRFEQQFEELPSLDSSLPSKSSLSSSKILVATLIDVVVGVRVREGLVVNPSTSDAVKRAKTKAAVFMVILGFR